MHESFLLSPPHRSAISQPAMQEVGIGFTEHYAYVLVSDGDSHMANRATAGDDILYAGADGATLLGGDGNDLIDMRGGAAVWRVLEPHEPMGTGWTILPDGTRLDLRFETVAGTAPDAPEANGGFGSDTLIGGDGGAILRGGKGHDSLIGGAGDDVLYSGMGNDTLEGGTGADKYYLKGFDRAFANAVLTPTITDFEQGVDLLAVENATLAELEAAIANQTVTDAGVVLTVAGASITLLGISQLTTADIDAGFYG